MNPMPPVNPIGTSPILVEDGFKIAIALIILLSMLVWAIMLWSTRRGVRDADILSRGHISAWPGPVDNRPGGGPGGRRSASASTTMRFGPLELSDRRQSR